MNFTVEKEYDYIPRIENNRDLPPDEQIVVTIKSPTTSEANLLFRTTGGQIDNSGMSLGVARLVKRIKNLTLDGMHITNGQELVEARGLFMIVQDIGSHILGKLTDLTSVDPT